MLEKHYTVKEAARKLHFSERRVRQQLESGVINGTKAGRKWLIEEAELCRHLGESVSGERGVHPDELGPHARELFYFGQSLRDRLRAPLPTEMVERTGRRRSLLWRGREHSWRRDGTDTEEEAVEKEWALAPFDARTHSLFPYFRDHLVDNPCWESLTVADAAMPVYAEACTRAHLSIDEKLATLLLELRADLRRPLADALLLDCYYRGAGMGGLSESYEPVRLGQRWRLQVGAWTIGDEDTRADLQLLMDAHATLIAEAPSWKSLRQVAEARRAVLRAVEAVQRALAPDARLRMLLRLNRCELCP